MQAPGTLVQHALEYWAAQSPEADFVIEQTARHSYASIERQANRFAQLLLSQGLARGDRVALLSQNSAFYVQAYYGVLKAGGIAVPVNTASDESMLEYFIGDSGAKVLAVGPGMERAVQRAGARLAQLDLLVGPRADRLESVQAKRVAWTEDGSAPVDRPSVGLTPDDVASIVYTSGSTGRPRGATLTHGNLVANIRSIVEYLQLSSADRALLVLPLYYVYGKSVLNTHAWVGASVVLENRFRYPNVALDALEAEQCTGFSGVPSSFAILLNRSSFAERELASLRYVTQAGSAMSPTLTRRLMHVLEGKQVFIMYGATEAGARLAYLPPDELPDHVGAIGRGIPGVELRVLDEEGEPCAVGEVGELVARGPNIMRGYWNAPEETALVLDEAGYHTGDLARQGADGIFYVVGRKKDMIKSGGHRISPKEIEDAVAESDAVDEVAVIGAPDEVLGEQIQAFIVLRQGSIADAASLGQFLKDRLPAYKIPRSFEFVAELPKNESGKVMKSELRKRQ